MARSGMICAPLEVDALGQLEAVAAADVGRRDVLVGVPQVVAGAAPDLDDVPEAAGRHQRRRREAPRDERVRRDGRAVGEQRDVAEVELGGGDAVHDALHRVARRARDLRDTHVRTLLVEHEHVGEGPTHVHRHSQSRHR
jgi:hypothetical protein